MTKRINWDNERLITLSLDELTVLRTNAIRYEELKLVSLCDAELTRRTPPKKRVVAPRTSSAGTVVGGFHFVCSRDHGVSQNADGTFWSGSWVVARDHAIKGERINAYIALHEKKSEPSYRQGIIKGWRARPRERKYRENPAQTEEGIEFLVEPTPDAYSWNGDGSGEKGYFWLEG